MNHGRFILDNVSVIYGMEEHGDPYDRIAATVFEPGRSNDVRGSVRVLRAQDGEIRSVTVHSVQGDYKRIMEWLSNDWGGFVDTIHGAQL